jgi:hypothetical protein
MKDWKVRHLGFIVRDIEAATAYYIATGLATLGPGLSVASNAFPETD